MSSPALSRREFIAAVCVVASTGCSDAPTSRESPEVVVTSDAIVIPLDAVPELARSGGYYVARRASVIVINLGGESFRAFSNVCTHAGCGIDRFERSRMICPCHGSEYDTRGVNVVGPAPEPLRELPVELDPVRGTLRVARQ